MSEDTHAVFSMWGKPLTIGANTGAGGIYGWNCLQNHWKIIKCIAYTFSAFLLRSFEVCNCSMWNKILAFFLRIRAGYPVNP